MKSLVHHTVCYDISGEAAGGKFVDHKRVNTVGRLMRPSNQWSKELPHTDHIPITYQPHTDNIPTTLPTTYR